MRIIRKLVIPICAILLVALVTAVSFAASPQLDGSGSGAISGNGNSISTNIARLTTTGQDAIIAFVSVTSAGITVSSVSDSGGAFTMKGSWSYTGNGNTLHLEEWYRIATSTVSSDNVVATLSTSTAAAKGIVVFGVPNPNTATPFDTNPSLEKAFTANGNPISATYSTSNPTDLLFSIEVGAMAASGFSVSSGWTHIASWNNGGVASPNAGDSAYQVVSTVQSGQTVKWGTFEGGSLMVIVDAIQQGATTTTSTTSTSSSSTVNPVISVTPTSGSAGSTYTISGTGFTPSNSVTINSPPSNYMATVMSGPNGAFSLTLTVTANAGTYTIQATDFSGLFARATFTVIATTTTTTTTTLSSSTSGQVYYYTGADLTSASNSGSTGIRATFQTVSQPLTGNQILSVWIDSYLTNNLWLQVGYYFPPYTNGTTAAVPFAQVWNLQTSTVLKTFYGSSFSASASSFHVYSANALNSTTWTFSIDGMQFGAYNFGTAISSTGSIQVYMEEQVAAVVQPNPILCEAIQFFNAGSWGTFSSATVTSSTNQGNLANSLWNIQGKLQNSASLSNDQVLIGGSGAVPSGTQLWNGVG